MGIKHLISFLKRILSLCAIYAISRMVFFFYNYSFNQIDELLLALVEGLRFDISALLYINLPVFVLWIIHFFIPHKKGFNRLINIIFYGINIPFILLNNVDIVFYAFNLKRSTADFFNFITYTDVKNVYLKYIIDYWQVSLLSCVQIGFLLSLKSIAPSTQRKLYAFATLIISLGVLIIGLRGGTQLKPIKPINAGVLSNCSLSDLVLNTPFTILHSYNQENLSPFNYIQHIDKTIYNPIHHYPSDSFSRENVVIIILESFSKEFVGYHNNGKGYTPFLDSIMSSGFVVENAYANGVRSIEALPAITASIPSLMTEPFITTSYANNSFESIARLLHNEGYSTSFFHGGERGTMGFYEFTKKSAFQDYYGREEYNNDADYDNNWGIYDEPFLQFFAQELSQTKEPFISTFFSLTSHPPYQIPEQHIGKFPKGTLDIHESIGYSDYALEQFFATAQQMDWFDNTLFVITADHTSPLSSNLEYKNKLGRYSVPLVFWKADNSLKGNTKTISQHTDIMPSILDIINYDKEFFSFGKSIFDNRSWAVSFLKGQYLFISDQNYLLNREEKYSSFTDKALKNKSETSDSLKLLLQSVKQDFNNRMIKNQMRVNEN